LLLQPLLGFFCYPLWIHLQGFWDYNTCLSLCICSIIGTYTAVTVWQSTDFFVALRKAGNSWAVMYNVRKFESCVAQH
jgi:hypothetical protein